MSTHCFYHSADLDGHCSGAIVKHFVPETVLHPINYGDAFPWGEVQPEDTVYMVDFCLQPFKEMDRLCDLCDVTWIDHHKTSMDFMQHRSIKGIQAIGHAACELAWTWFSINQIAMPLAVTLLGRYDVWDHSDPRTLPFQYRMRMEDLDPLKGEGAMAKWETLFDPFDDGGIYTEGSEGQYLYMSDLVREGELLLRYEEQQNLKVCRAYAFETDLCVTGRIPDDGAPTPTRRLSAICLNRGMTNSQVFDSIYDPEKHHLMITFCRLPLHKQAKGGWTVSLYSAHEDIDCGAIAKTFGGGGHKGAAGFLCDVLPFRI